jgi:protein SCO1/2
MTFMYSTCQDSCPATAQTIRLALDQLGDRGQGVPVYAISVDPAGDTAEHTRRFLLKQSLLGRMHFLRGSERRLAPVWRQYGVQKQGRGSKQFDDHTISVLIIGRDGRQRVSLPLDNLSPEAVAHDLRRVLAE